MSWFWGSSSSDGDPKTTETLGKLDPDLKDFLAKQTPSKYEPNSSKLEPEKPSYRAQLGLSSDSDPAAEAPKPIPPEERPLPQESLFPDGRYKHLWATYRPQHEVEAAGKSESEKLTDLVASYKDRKASIGRAALENCAEEQWNVHECFRSGGWKSRMTMCKAENRALDRCYTMQSRFLRALGYMSLYERPGDEIDAIQLRAHDLYHEMLEQERLIKEAEDKGLTPPTFEPILPGTKPVSALAAAPTVPRVEEKPALSEAAVSRWEALSPGLKEKLPKKKFEGLSEKDQDFELKAAEGELAADVALAQTLQQLHMEQRRDRLRRRAAGRERISDKIGRWFDFRDWETFDKQEMEKIKQEAERANEFGREK